MFYSLPDTIQDSLSIYLKVSEPVVRPDPLQVDFGYFEYLPVESNRLLFAIDPTFLETIHQGLPGKGGVALASSSWVMSVLFLLFIACFVVLAIVVRNSRGAFIANFKKKLSLRKEVATGYKMQVTTAEVWGDFFMIGQTLLLITILFFVCFLENTNLPPSLGGYLVGFLALFFGLALFAAVKFLMYKVISLFFLPRDITRWRRRYYGHLQLLGILLFFPALVFVFLPEYRNVMLLVMLCLFLINRLMVLISLFTIFVKNKVGLLYFILYLCGTEIAPYLLFYKGALSIVNIAGNYLV